MKIRIALLAGVALTMWGLKRYYADAPVDALDWILRPTAAMATLLSGVAFEPQPGEGFVSRERLFVIEKACAGINFMIAAFGMTAWLLRRHATSLLRAADVLVVALVGSYAAAVIVNAGRIAFALWLGGHPVRIAALTAAQAHRVEGIVFYFGGLLLLHELIRFVDAPGQLRRSAAVPLIAYYGIAVAVPLANGAAFGEHFVFVILVPLLLIALSSAVWLVRTLVPSP